MPDVSVGSRAAWQLQRVWAAQGAKMSLGDCDSRAGRDRDLSEHRHRATVPEQEEWSRPGHGNQA